MECVKIFYLQSNIKLTRSKLRTQTIMYSLGVAEIIFQYEVIHTDVL